MKKSYILLIALFAFITVRAQWTVDAATNTFLANTSADAGEIILSTAENGDTYIQWNSFVGGNGWAPTLQRISATGEPLWSFDGIHPNYHAMSSWSQGVAMTATSDGGVVTCFANEAGNTIAIKINADGTYAWGEQGLTLFGGAGDSRTELLAGDDGGVWALGSGNNYTDLFLCYIEADGTLNPTITLTDEGGKQCMFGLLVPTYDGVFVVYEKESWAYTYYYEKEIWVEGYNKFGHTISESVRLMAPQVMIGSYVHHVVPDMMGGAYVYIWHAGIYDAYNTYVFHFDHYGASTISDINGVPVHTGDYNNFYLDAYATLDPVSHDLVIGYIQTDAEFQRECKIYANRINEIGERSWGDDGRILFDNGYLNCSDLMVDAFEYGEGFSIIFSKCSEQMSDNETVEAMGFDMKGDALWATTLSSQSYRRAVCDNTTGFHNGQNIVTWVNATTGGLYGQNIGWDGNMGDNISPITPSYISENPSEEIIDVTEIYNINGQRVNTRNVNELNQGIYIIRGVTASGKTGVKKIVR